MGPILRVILVLYFVGDHFTLVILLITFSNLTQIAYCVVTAAPVS